MRLFDTKWEKMISEERWMFKDVQGNISLEKVGPVKWTAKRRCTRLYTKWIENRSGNHWVQPWRCFGVREGGKVE